MKIPPVKYMRDFYPEDMRFRNWIEDQWRRASAQAGFEPWDAPIVEHLDLYKQKSGDEIVNQLYTITTRGGDELAIRPEMTPSLARMISQRQSALPRPIKWYCMARMCRYERGQRGRLREFWQWNVDVLGVDDPIADAEVISVALDGLAALGLTSQEIEVRINSRSFLARILTAIGIPEADQPRVYAVTDKRGKVPDADLEKMYREQGLADAPLGRLLELMSCQSLDDIESFVAKTPVDGSADPRPPLDELKRLFDYLDALGKRDYCRFDIGIVRGLAYYTGPVFEIFDRGAKLRALCGGGRYDNLMQAMGGQPMPAVGFGLGDVVLGELLRELGKTPPAEAAIEYHVIPLEPERLTDAVLLTGRLRARGLRADYAMKAGALGKAMKRASASSAGKVVLVGGQEWSAGKVRVHDMATGDEQEISVAEI